MVVDDLTQGNRRIFKLARRRHCTPGEGWHNNHHHFMNSTRQGFFWWEIDISYYTLKVLSWLGIVWDLKEPPARVYEADLTTPVDVPVPPTPEQREAA